ncbi:AAA-like domain-containing protein [Brasilonema bromeliae]|uniref:LuxR family transcriptional regulator n=1 Tax=Brasilonema bromeliae SPC951 TaxID=385972 RepID=A0ABX1P502_9CYAN|nr:AAA-like domain-containing protein [Brasilonema bromeliae]NMG19450.1 LuxR family transcriptional regulator [Brasilonema bromeliae SPC951]
MHGKKFNDILDELTPDQKKVLKRFLAGETDEQIASERNCDTSTIRKHLNKVCTKFGLVNREGERFSYRPELVDLFVQDKPKWVNFDYWEDHRPDQIEPDFPGRPISSQSPFYIQRFYNEHLLLEKLCSQKVLQSGALIRIKAPKKTGKTSLVNKILAEARHCGYRTIRLNLRQAEELILENLDHFLQWFCTNISQQLNLESRIDDYWDNKRLGSMVSCTTYFQAYLLEQIDTPLVLGLDEVDRLFEYEKIAKSFFTLLRSWHEEANNLQVWQKLRLVVAYSTEVYIPLNINQSPFNVGIPVKLPNLTLAQVQQLAKEYGLKSLDNTELERLRAMIGGHPYLIQLGLYHLHQKDLTLEQLLQTAPTLEGIYSSHLQGLWVMLSEHHELLEALRTLLDSGGKVQMQQVPASKLESMGIVQFEANQVKFSCQLYHSYFLSCLGAK